MAIDFCALCSDVCTGKNAIIGNNNMQETWRTLVAQALCSLSTNNPFSSEAVQLEQVEISAATLTASFTAYADAGLLDAEARLRRLTAINTTDSDIDISLDNGVSTHFRVMAGTTRDYDLGNHIFAAQDDLQIRRSTGMTAGIGSLYLEGGY